MKKVLLATTALVATAGFAAAEVTFSGKADVGIARTSATEAKAAPTGAALTAANAEITAATNALAAVNADIAASTAANKPTSAAQTQQLAKATARLTAANAAAGAVAEVKAGEFEVFTGVDFEVAVSATTDSGVKFSTSFDLGAGSTADYNDDYVLDAQTDDLTVPTIKIEFGNYTAEIEQDGIDNLYDDDYADQDIKLSGAMSGVTFAIAHDLDDADDGTSYKFGYNMDTLSVTLTGTTKGAGTANDSANKLAVSYGIAGATVSASMDKEGNAKTNKIGVSYATNGFTVGVTAVDPSDGKMGDDWDLSVGYAANGMTFNVATDEESDWELNATYDLGGGVSAYLGSDHTDFVAAGMRFTF